MIKIQQGNAVSALLNGDVDYLIHCTNAQGKYASGIAGEIRRRIPTAYEAYMKQYNTWKERGNKHIPLGDISSAKGVINLCGQKYYGNDGKWYVNYGAIASGLCSIFCYLQDMDFRHPHDLKIGLPLIGCGLAGGDEEIMTEIIEHCLVGFKSVTVYKL